MFFQGTETVLGIYFNASALEEAFSMDEKSFEGMRNLQFLIVRDYVGYWVPQGRLLLPQGLFYIPRKLRLLRWDAYPSKCLPSNFKAEYLVELRMKNSSLEKLWEGTLVLLLNLFSKLKVYHIYLFNMFLNICIEFFPVCCHFSATWKTQEVDYELVHVLERTSGSL